MTWARNYGDRFHVSDSQVAKRAKAIEKTCVSCGTGILRRKTYCGPCYAGRLQENITKNSRRYSAKKRAEAAR